MLILHTETFAHRFSYTQMLLHRDAFSHGKLYLQKVFFYTEAFTQILTQMLLHTDSFDTHTHKRRFYTQALNTQVLLRTGALTHRCLYTQVALQKEPFTNKKSHTHTEV